MKSARWIVAVGLLGCAIAQASTRVLGGFDDPSRWRLQASEGAQARLTRVSGADGGRALCIAADFGAHAGSVRLSAPLALDLPPDGRLQLSSRGQAAQAQLSLHILDEAGRRYGAHHAGRTLSTRWQGLDWWLSEFSDAAGNGLALPARSQRVELRLASASGGQAQWCIDNLALQVRPEDQSPFNPVALADTATALQQRMVDGRADTLWVSSGVKQQTVSLDLGREREVGGLVVQWAAGLRADKYRVQASNDGRRWQQLRQVNAPAGTTDRLRLGPLTARYLRLDLEDGPNWRYGIVDLLPQHAAFGRSTEAFLREVGRPWPAGVLPASISDGPVRWTVLGAEAAPAPVWFSEQGIIEPRPGQFTLTPQLQIDGSWHGAEQMQVQPVAQPAGAQSRWQHTQAQLTISASTGHDAQAQPWLRVRYRLANPDASSHRYALALALRPFQLHAAGRLGDLPGGAGWIEQVAVSDAAVAINGAPALLAAQRADAAFASHFDAGLDLNLLRAAQLPQARQASDGQGLASAVMLWRQELAAGQSREWEVWLPLSDPAMTSAVPTRFTAQAVPAEGWQLPGEQGRWLVDSWQAAVARMRAERNGPWLRTDSRRSIGAANRDSMHIASALMRADQADAVLPWLLARIATGSTRHCPLLAHWAQLAAQAQLAGAWSPAQRQALQPWVQDSLARYQPGGACAELAASPAPDPASVSLQLAALLPEPALALGPAQGNGGEVVQADAGAGQVAAAAPVPGVLPAGPLAVSTALPLPPGEPVSLAQRQQLWEAALALRDDRLLPGWQQWQRGQSQGLLDARQAAEQVQAIAATVVQEQADHLRLLPGLPASAWQQGQLQVPGVLTRWGRLGLQGRREGSDWVLEFAPGLQAPPAGLVLDWPFAQPPAAALVDGLPQPWQSGRLHLRSVPVQLRIALPVP